MRNNYWSLLLAVLGYIISQSVNACQANTAPSPANFNFGSQTTVTIAQNAVAYTPALAGYFVITCPSVINAALLTSDIAHYRLLDRLRLTNGTHYIDLAMSPYSTFTPALTAANDATGNILIGTLLDLGLLSGPTLNIPIYLRTLATVTWPAPGVYSGTFRAEVGGTLCTLSVLGLGLLCLETTTIPQIVVTFSISLTVEKYCQFISVPALHNMGTVGLLSAATETAIAVQIRCGNTEDFLIHTTQGQHYQSGSRRLSAGAGNFIRYDIFHPGPASTTPLGISSASGSFGAVATGIGQTFNFPVRVSSGQSTPPAGVYEDVISFILEY